MLGWPKICKFAHAFLWEHSGKRLKLAQLLGQLGDCLTLARYAAAACRNGLRAGDADLG